MKETVDYITNELLKRGIKSKIRKSKKSKSMYIIVKHMPEIRISDHIGNGGVKQYQYNIIIGDKSIMSNKTTILIKNNKAIFYYSKDDSDKLINSYEVLYKKRNLI